MLKHKCFLCDIPFRSTEGLVWHATTVHGANRAVLERAVEQAADGVVVLVRTERGALLAMVQPGLV